MPSCCHQREITALLTSSLSANSGIVPSRRSSSIGLPCFSSSKSIRGVFCLLPRLLIGTSRSLGRTMDWRMSLLSLEADLLATYWDSPQSVSSSFVESAFPLNRTFNEKPYRPPITVPTFITRLLTRNYSLSDYQVTIHVHKPPTAIPILITLAIPRIMIPSCIA